MMEKKSGGVDIVPTLINYTKSRAVQVVLQVILQTGGSARDVQAKNIQRSLEQGFATPR
jgi:hypothetical protein